MLKKDNIHKVLELFFDNPLTEGIGFQLREISRAIKLAPKSVKIYLEELEIENLIIKKQHRIHKYPVYYANRDNDYFKFMKKLDIVQRIKECMLLDYLNDKCMPDVIMLFGSASNGEDIQESDIDLYIQSDKKKLNLKKYEKTLNRTINLFFEKNFNKLSNELKSNIINGIKLSGYLVVNC
jgi:predicted nucleotidyltransferase